VQFLLNGLKDNDTKIRRMAAEALGGIGPDAKPAIPALAEALKDTDEAVRLAAVEALAGIGAERPTIVALVEAMKDKSHKVKKRSIEVLGNIGEPTVALLLEAMKTGTRACVSRRWRRWVNAMRRPRERCRT